MVDAEKLKPVLSAMELALAENDTITYLPQAICVLRGLIDGADADPVEHPAHYREGTADMIDKAIDGLTPQQGAAMFNVLKYWERAGKKGDLDEDLAKCNNYIFRAIHGKFRWEVEDGNAQG